MLWEALGGSGGRLGGSGERLGGSGSLGWVGHRPVLWDALGGSRRLWGASRRLWVARGLKGV